MSIKSTLIVSFLTLFTLSSAISPDTNRIVQISKRSPVAQPEIPFYQSGIVRRQVTQPKVVIGNSNPAPQEVNLLGDSTPAIGKTNGVITPFKAGGQKFKRDPQATQPKVVIGTSNPPPADTNNLADSTPSVGKTNGLIKAFQAGGVAGVNGKRAVLGTSNPSLVASNQLNVVSDNQAAGEVSDGELEDLEDPADDDENVEKRNLIPHRGFADGTIELF